MYVHVLYIYYESSGSTSSNSSCRRAGEIHISINSLKAGLLDKFGFLIASNGNSFREFRDVVFEDVVFDNNSCVTPYQVKSKYRIR